MPDNPGFAPLGSASDSAIAGCAILPPRHHTTMFLRHCLFLGCLSYFRSPCVSSLGGLVALMVGTRLWLSASVVCEAPTAMRALWAAACLPQQMVMAAVSLKRRDRTTALLTGLVSVHLTTTAMAATAAMVSAAMAVCSRPACWVQVDPVLALPPSANLRLAVWHRSARWIQDKAALSLSPSAHLPALTAMAAQSVVLRSAE